MGTDCPGSFIRVRTGIVSGSRRIKIIAGLLLRFRFHDDRIAENETGADTIPPRVCIGLPRESGSKNLHCFLLPLFYEGLRFRRLRFGFVRVLREIENGRNDLFLIFL